MTIRHTELMIDVLSVYTCSPDAFKQPVGDCFNIHKRRHQRNQPQEGRRSGVLVEQYGDFLGEEKEYAAHRRRKYEGQEKDAFNARVARGFVHPRVET